MKYGGVIGGPGPRTSAAMRAGKPTTADDLQKIHEASRRGAPTPPTGRPVMIEETEIDGRHAIVSYLDDDFRPVPKGEETLIKVLFDDGELVFAVPAREEAGNE